MKGGWGETRQKTSSTYNNFFTPVPTRVTHPDFMSCSSRLFLTGFAPSWNPQWRHRQSHRLLPPWRCVPDDVILASRGWQTGRWWYNHSAGEGQDAFMAIWMWRKSTTWQTPNALLNVTGSTPVRRTHTQLNVRAPTHMQVSHLFLWPPGKDSILCSSKHLVQGRNPSF